LKPDSPIPAAVTRREALGALILLGQISDRPTRGITRGPANDQADANDDSILVIINSF
jgi:hypothetical protein